LRFFFENFCSICGKKRKIRKEFTVAITAIQKSQIHVSDDELKHHFRIQQQTCQKKLPIDK